MLLPYHCVSICHFVVILTPLFRFLLESCLNIQFFKLLVALVLDVFCSLYMNAFHWFSAEILVMGLSLLFLAMGQEVAS